MPVVTTMRFTAEYSAVVEAFRDMVKNPIITEREEQGRAVTDIEGDFEHFVLEDLDLWREHLKFEIKDNHILDEKDRETRAILAEGLPEFGAVLFSPTIAFVYRQVKVVTTTETIIRRIEDGKRETIVDRKLEESGSPVIEWVDITKEFGQKVRINREGR